MKTRCIAVLGTALGAGVASLAGAAEGLTLGAAVAVAKERSAAILSARRSALEAEGRLRTRPSLRNNPEVEAALGSRDGAASNDFELELSQTLELGGRGSARRSIDEAAVARERSEAEEVERAVLREVRAAFLRGLHAAERLSLARSVGADSGELYRIAERRHAAGDIAALEVNVAASGLARARAEVKASEAALAAAHGGLRALLDMPVGEPLSLAGALTEERGSTPDRLPTDIDERPEIRALHARLREVEAEIELGQGLAWPDLTPAVRYEQDQGDRVLWAGLRIGLPVFDRGQQMRETGRIRADGLRSEIEARRRAIGNQVQTALTMHDLRLAAVNELTANADRLAENETLARRSYEVGQIGLAELLLLRRESTDARREWLDRLLELAEARAELDSLAGASR